MTCHGITSYVTAYLGTVGQPTVGYPTMRYPTMRYPALGYPPMGYLIVGCAAVVQLPRPDGIVVSNDSNYVFGINSPHVGQLLCRCRQGIMGLHFLVLSPPSRTTPNNVIKLSGGCRIRPSHENLWWADFHLQHALCRQGSRDQLFQDPAF